MIEMALDAAPFTSLGFALIFVGVIIVIAAFLLLFLSGLKGGGEVRGGGAIIIGPFPIVFGTDKESVRAVLWLSIMLTVLLFAFFILFYLLGR
ncbi:MAG: DUF131 domain-containing protein [Candidatus Bathyarchaeia archaeon]